MQVIQLLVGDTICVHGVVLVPGTVVLVANGPSCTPVAESNEDGIDVHIDVLDESARRGLFKHHIVLIDIIDARALHEFKDSFHRVNRSDLTETNCNGVRHRFLLEVEIREALERLLPRHLGHGHNHRSDWHAQVLLAEFEALELLNNATGGVRSIHLAVLGGCGCRDFTVVGAKHHLDVFDLAREAGTEDIIVEQNWVCAGRDIGETDDSRRRARFQRWFSGNCVCENCFWNRCVY